MRVVIIGLGLQGQKRLACAGKDIVSTVDPVMPQAVYREIESVPLDSFDAAMVCTPDDAKLAILRRLLSQGKNVLVEKPLIATSEADLLDLAEIARNQGVVCYTAYNHRFEPNLIRLKEILTRGVLGTIYTARLFYGNGTAADVKRSPWRDQGSGVLADLGSHLLDLVLFLFGRPDNNFRLWAFDRFENRACDHVAFGVSGEPTLQLEATLLSWRNTFSVDVIGAQGSAHINGLCKWGPSKLTLRKRVLPSGRPDEEVHTVTSPDPTWALENAYFKDLCQTGGTNLENDIWIQSTLTALYQAAQDGERP